MLTTLLLSAALTAQTSCPGGVCPAQRAAAPYNPSGAAYSVPATYRTVPRVVIARRYGSVVRWRGLFGWRRGR